MKVVDRTYSLEGNISDSKPVWFNNTQPLPAGYYTIRYKGGAYKLPGDDGWAVGCDWMLVNSVSTGVTDLFKPPCSGLPGHPTYPNGTYPGFGYDSQEAAETATRGIRPKFFYYSGGLLGLILYASNYSGTKGTIAPTWELLHYIDDTPEAESDSSSSSSGDTSAATDDTSETQECGQAGLMSPADKAFLDSLPSHPGGFGLIFPPGVYITQKDGVDSVLTGDITLTSSSLKIECLNGKDGQIGTNGEIINNIIKFSVSDQFLNSFCIEVKSRPGPRGDKGPKGKDGRHGTGDGPKGAKGPNGKDATIAHTFTGVKVVELNEVRDTAVVNMVLDPKTCTLEVVKAKMAVPESDEPASKVIASPIYRGIRFNTRTLDSWELVGANDAAAIATGTVDLDVIKLPSGWNGQVTGAVPVATMKLSQLIRLLVNYYKNRANNIISKWDKQIKDYVIDKDKEARTILAELAQELTECEFSTPAQFCVDIAAIPCN